MWEPWSLRALVAEIASGTCSAEDAMQRSRDRVAATEPALKAWVSYEAVVPVGATGGPLHGVALGVKDTIDVAGLPTRHGSALHDDAAACDDDAAIVTAWRAAGAVPVGKTVTAEFAFFTPGPTRNPADLDHTPGSSSSGSAAAVAAGHVPLAIGTQTGASTTRPASYCGIASLTLASKRFPMDGVLGISPSIDRHGLFAARVGDVALAWSALAGAEDVGLREDRTPPRLLLWTGEPFELVSASMSDALSHAVKVLVAAGATIDPFPREQLAVELAGAYEVVTNAEVRTERARELAIAEQIGPRWVALREASMLTSEEHELRARRTVAAGLVEVTAALSGYDAILGPAATGAAPSGLEFTGDPTMSIAWQTVGLPAVAVPGQRDAAGLPLGLQVIAHSELAALHAALWVEQQIGASQT